MEHELQTINQRIKNDNFRYIKRCCGNLFKRGVIYTNHNSFRRYNPYTSNFDKISDKEVLEMFNNIFYNNWGNFNNVELVKKHSRIVNMKTLENYHNYLNNNDRTDQAKNDFKKIVNMIKLFK